jgi:hypothetical protein
MIYELSRDLQDMLRARKYPVTVEYGPERTLRDGYPENVILIERDRESGDSVETAHGSQRNPRKMRTRKLGAIATIWARSNLPGARIGDHERACEGLVDALIISLEEWGTEARAGDIPITSARYATAADHNDVETWPGVVYLLRFQVPRGMLRRDYTGEARPESPFTGVSNQTRARLTGAEDEDPEIGCGAA